MKTIRPPGIFHPIRIETAVGVCKTGLQQLRKPVSLLIGESGVCAIGFRIFQIYFFMGDIHVSADDNRFFSGKPAQISAEIILPFHPVIQPFQAVLRIRRVDIYQIKIRIFQGDHPSLMVMFLYTQPQRNRKRLLTGKNRGSGVAFFFRVVPELIITLCLQINLTGLKLTLLNAEEISVRPRKIIHKAFFQAGSQSVYIPGNQSDISQAFLLLSPHNK